MPSPTTDAEQGEAVLTEAVVACKDALGDRLLAAYALGSLAHGGFSALVSDVDLGLVLADPIQLSDSGAIVALAQSVRSRGSALYERLSVFWGTPSTLQGRSTGGRFPALDRLDLLEHGRLIHGKDARSGIARPGQVELLVMGAEFALEYLGGRQTTARPGAGLGSMVPGDDSVLQEIRNPALLVSRGPRRLTKIVLFPVRFLFTAATGQVGTNTLAVKHYLADAPGHAGELVAAALAWRHEPPEDSHEATSLLGRELIPLYLHYIDDHARRLRSARRSDLAESFEQWRARIIG